MKRCFTLSVFGPVLPICLRGFLLAGFMIGIALAQEDLPPAPEPFPPEDIELPDLPELPDPPDLELPALEDLVPEVSPEASTEEAVNPPPHSAITKLGVVPTLPKSLQITGGTPFYNSADSSLTYTGKVKIIGDNGLQLFANKITVYPEKEIAVLTDDVSIYQGNLVQKCSRAVYDYKNKKLHAANLQAGLDPFLVDAGVFKAKKINGRQVLVGKNAGVTTHDYMNPGFWIRADEIVIYPGEKVVFRDLKFHVGDTAIFWLPYLSQSLNREMGYRFTPGFRTNWGAYLLNSYSMMLGGEKSPLTGNRENAPIKAKWHLDLLSRRGVGLGADLHEVALNNYRNFGWLKLYYVYDFDPNLERSATVRSGVNSNRYAAEFRHRQFLPPNLKGETYLDSNFKLLSDEFYLEDFQPNEFRHNPSPDNTLSLVHRRPRILFTMLSRWRPNSFYQSDLRLPEVHLDVARGSVLDSSLLYESQTSLGLIREEPVVDRQYLRFNTWHEISYPIQIDNWLNIVPRAGVGFTGYGDVHGPASSGTRNLAFIGLDASFKLTKAYPKIQSHRLGLDGILHVVQPYASFSHLSASDLPADFTPIDILTATSRPRPINVGRWAATDSLTDWSILRLGTRNRLFTKRNGGTHEWLTLDTYFDAFANDPEFQRKFSNLYNDLTWNPVPWINLSLETQVPISNEDSSFSEIALDARFMPTENLEFSVNYRRLNNHSVLLDSNRIRVQGYARLNEAWGIGMAQGWELDEGRLENQQYSIHRDLQSWIFSAAAYHRDNPQRDEYGVLFSFTLKDFPSLSLPIKLDTE